MARTEVHVAETLVDDIEPIRSGEPFGGGSMPPTRPPANGIVAEFDEVEVNQRDAMLLEYATTWFVYHAGQRIQSFNFFIVIQGAFVAASLGLFAHRGDALGFVIVTFIGLLLVCPFLVLEVRNAELVANGRHTLDKFEQRLMGGSSELVLSDLPVYRDTHRLDINGCIPKFTPFRGRFQVTTKSEEMDSDEAAKRNQKDSDEPNQQRAPWAKYLKHTLMLRTMYLTAQAAWVGLFVFALIRLFRA
jgi:hypothetical protein